MRFGISNRERKLITLALLSAEALLIYLFILKPKLVQLGRAKSELSSQSKLYEVKKGKVQLLPKIEEDYLKVQTDYLKVKRRFFTSSEIDSFIRTFSSLARGTRVYLVGIQPYQRIESSKAKAVKEPGDVRRQRLQIVVRGRYEDVLNLLSQIESDPKAITIDQMAITRSANSKKYVELAMVVSLYWVEQEGGGKG
jgi:Tfp pilus assembly protein PilO